MQVRRRGPDPWVYSSCDYASVELSTLAQVCLNLGFESKMAEAINRGEDLHTKLACSWINIPYEEGMRRKKAGDPEIKSLRQSAKPVNFGKPGLMGPPKMVLTARKDDVYFCEGAGRSKKDECWKNDKAHTYGSGRNERSIPPTCAVCLELAVKYSEGWYQTFPEMHDYHDFTIATAKRCERGIPFPSYGTGMLRLDTNPNAVSNHFFQNLAAQGAKNALWLIQRESYTDRRSVLFNNARVAVFVHDETIAELREHVGHEAAYRQAEMMKKGMAPFVPDVRVDVEPALMRRLFKGAEKAIDRNGRLKPWWPVDPGCKWPQHRTDEPCSCWTWGPDQELMAEDLAS